MTRRLVSLALALATAIAPASPARALDREQARAVYRRLAKTFPERRIFYRWQSRASGLTLLREETFTPKLRNYFMGMRFDSRTMHGGRGIYVAETLFTSSRFIRGDDEGTLIEIVVERGTPYIDLEDPSTLRQLEAAGLTGSRSELAELEPELIVRYRQGDVNAAYRDWWVLKSSKGVRFQKFNPGRLSLDELRKVYDQFQRFAGDGAGTARRILVSRLTEEQRLRLGWKKTYFHSIEGLLEKVVAPVKARRKPTPEDLRFFNQLLERLEEATEKLAITRFDGALFDHPAWTDETLRKLLQSLFREPRSFNDRWARHWVGLLADHRARLHPILTAAASEDLGKRMVVHLFTASSRYDRDRTREFSRLFRDSAPSGLADLLAYAIPARRPQPIDYIDLVETLSEGLGAKELEARIGPALELAQRRFAFTPEDRQRISKALPSLSAKLWPVSAANAGSASSALSASTEAVASGPRDADRIRAHLAEARAARKLDEYSVHGADAVPRWIDPLLGWNPTGEELKELERIANDRSFARKLRRKALDGARTAAQFIDYLGTAFDPGNEAYRELLDEVAEERLPRFLSLVPTDEERVAFAARLQFPQSSVGRRIVARLAETSRDPGNFAAQAGVARCRATLGRR